MTIVATKSTLLTLPYRWPPSTNTSSPTSPSVRKLAHGCVRPPSFPVIYTHTAHYTLRPRSLNSRRSLAQAQDMNATNSGPMELGTLRGGVGTKFTDAMLFDVPEVCILFPRDHPVSTLPYSFRTCLPLWFPVRSVSSPCRTRHRTNLGRTERTRRASSTSTSTRRLPSRPEDAVA